MLKNCSIWITSWARYNSNIAGAGWFEIVKNGYVSTIDDLMDFLKEKGFKINGFDEELTIHDYDDENEFNLHEHFGEAYPSQIIEFFQKLEDLKDYEIELFIAITEAHGLIEAIEALDANELDFYKLIYDIDDYIEEILSSYEIDDFIRRHIDYESIKNDLSFDMFETSQGWLYR